MTHLYLFPNRLDEKIDLKQALAPEVATHFANVEYLIAESHAGARRYCKGFGRIIDQEAIFLCNEHTTKDDLEQLYQKMAQGGFWGLISDAGLPCIADPGAQIVAYANKQRWAVTALAGPSSILLGLMLSGFSGQRFYFVGYLPRDRHELQERVAQLVQLGNKERATIIAIEAPYRTKALLRSLIELLPPTYDLSVSLALTSDKEVSCTKTISQWRQGDIEEFVQEKLPAIFCLSPH
jgi:16S rRNA (cytidine1402-2'-O)-methyltransferase